MSGFWREVLDAFIGATPSRCTCPQQHEVECPSCGAAIRARMADAPEPKGQSPSWRHGYATGVNAGRAGITNPGVPDA